LEANKLFTSACYDQAISCYDRALASCPNYLDYDVAVLRSNISACYLKLEDWKAAVDSATACLDCLDRVIPPSAQQDNDKSKGKESAEPQEDAVVEIAGDNEEAEKEELDRLRKIDEQKRDVARIRGKALMRRAKARSQQSNWANLQGAEEDYKTLAAMDNLPPDDRRVVQRALRELPARINQAREKEMSEMMGKLKDVSQPDSLALDRMANFAAGKWYSQTVWALYGQLQLCSRSQDGWLQHELPVMACWLYLYLIPHKANEYLYNTDNAYLTAYNLLLHGACIHIP